ncbi:putative uridine kinase [Maudiozyma humilis]|uniref:Uridine kinase n=1 Tax=Maudiozyma humilis TaxID=51915 RepID=A0AAV5S6G6_MAUHU|nr:putative uridine kinase [Kazachstania humilis]
MPNTKLVISLAGGHATGIVNVARKLQSSIAKFFSDTTVTIIDLDEIAKDNAERTYSGLDIDFDELYFDLKNITHDGIDIIIICGCYALYDKRINDISKLKVFLDSDGDKRLINLILKEKADTPDKLSALIAEYMDNLRPEMIKYIEPTIAHADLIIPYENEEMGFQIILDGVIKVIDQIDGGKKKHTATPVWDYENERMDVQKERYLDLS